MMKYITVAITLAAINIPNSWACTYEDAQTKLISFNNMMSIYSRKINDYYGRGEEPPMSLRDKVDSMSDQSTALGISLSEESDKNPNIQFTDKVDPAICQGYDALMAKYAPADYKPAPVTTTKWGESTKCGSTDLWDRFYAANDRQIELAQAGRITKAEQSDYMNLSTLVGQYSTTDVAKACQTMDQIEAKLEQE